MKFPKDVIFVVLVTAAILLLLAFTLQIIISMNTSMSYVVPLPAWDSNVQGNYYYSLRSASCCISLF